MSQAFVSGQMGIQRTDGEGLVIRPGGVLYAWKFGPYRDFSKIGAYTEYDSEKNMGEYNASAVAYQTLTIHEDGSYELGGNTAQFRNNPVGYWYRFNETSIWMYRIARTAYSSTTQGVAYYNLYIDAEYKLLPPGLDAEGIIFSRESVLPDEYKEAGKTYASVGSLNATPTI